MSPDHIITILTVTTVVAGEVEYFSILDNKLATKNYWESRMLATMNDEGWESVANVRFQPIPGVTPVHVQVSQPAT